jgi:hypothetical protein
MQQQFFQTFFGPGMSGMQEIQSPIPEYITYNELILEINNNWVFVKDLMRRHKEGTLKQIDTLEQTWFTFLMQNNINIEIYQNDEEFKKAFWKVPVITT